jgi:Arc/MetJ family transcription regulator
MEAMIGWRASFPPHVRCLVLHPWALKWALNDDRMRAAVEASNMRTTLALDDDLVAKAQAFTGLKEKSSLIREALKALIERESARRLARLGGSEPDLKAPPRRRPASA